MEHLEIGLKAPDFALFDSTQKKHSLIDSLDQWLLLFFYPKDNTPGCTKEVCHFRDDFAELSTMNTRILGINTDSGDSHNLFIKQQKLPFPLLTDNKGEISRLYGCLFKLGPIKFCKRHSFIIDPQGNIAKIYRKVTPSEHSQQVISDLRVLQENKQPQ